MRFLKEEYINSSNIFNEIDKHFIDYIGGAGYILPNGRIITPLSNNKDEFEINVHMNIEDYLNNINLSNEHGGYDTGSPTMRRLGAIRLNNEEWENNYIELPSIRPTNNALNALLMWLDKNSTQYKYIMVCSPGMKSCKKYNYTEYIPEDIIKKIKRYYSSGNLYENLITEAGYHNYSMSNNAIQAYEEGEKPFSKWSKEEILEAIKQINPKMYEPAKKVKAYTLKLKLLCNSSWHHTSSYYNRTNFYSIDEEAIENLDLDEINFYIARDKEDEEKKLKKVSTVKYKGDIGWLEWGGTRAHPKPIERELNNVNIEEKGCFYIVTNDNGYQLLRKKMDSNGTWVRKTKK